MKKRKVVTMAAGADLGAGRVEGMRDGLARYVQPDMIQRARFRAVNAAVRPYLGEVLRVVVARERAKLEAR